MKFLAAEALVKQVMDYTKYNLVIVNSLYKAIYSTSKWSKTLILNLGIYRNAQRPVVEESFSPKVKSMIDVFNNGNTSE